MRGDCEKQEWKHLLGQTVVDENGRVRDVELTQWYLSHEKVMCAECAAAVQQKLYCVHGDSIAAQDQRLAEENGREHGQHLPLIRTSAGSSLAVQHDCIADKLWEQFMKKHPGFSGALQEFHLSAF
eukprot:2018195-Rhodomonas_salina.1